MFFPGKYPSGLSNALQNWFFFFENYYLTNKLLNGGNNNILHKKHLTSYQILLQILFLIKQMFPKF